MRKVKFKYYGEDPDSILDRIQTAQIVLEEDDYVVFQAEVFGKGIDMWMRSQGELIEMIA